MNRYEIHLKDIERILLGQAPPIFLLEVFFRALVTYTLLLFIVRWLGKRMTGELTLMEMAVMVTLGAIVSTPMQVAERGILQGLVLLLCAVGLQRGISYLGYRSHKIENLTQGRPSLMVKDGVFQLRVMEDDRISREQLIAELRQQKILGLGAVERVYLEATGTFSVYQYDKKQPGLPLYPKGDEVIKEEGQGMIKPEPDFDACVNCGAVKQKSRAGACKNCNYDQFTTAVV
ncbi:DUF421 domain-containing protein [Mucilaginibacter phyllosphaerae]|uniref:DUF421 domain-containing protein n=1 Tax=Mucilaginibacter phyllosphaerae TaxID=1812349 RepID=A0A4Y8ACD0_9SPHI|nr:YetF domain-containing protein [Mucilaginibacter phyllosphaerae]MBB3969482.1 uncharacterized membrane protein YcaP (DUF421 family) [Mucilaginibacter phyllosphaerae]TEW65739.1 DUF421 domain-containing protein [Mucilaginibacter phyllosphaerae]GGH08887.1 hypothetical protein GCM10007352_14120 [Mucilaginibacter phyllosphaerae]